MEDLQDPPKENIFPTVHAHLRHQLGEGVVLRDSFTTVRIRGYHGPYKPYPGSGGT